MEWVIVQQFYIDVATIVVGVGGPLNGALMHLFQNNIVPTPTTPIGSYTEADYDGYATEAITWLAVTVSDAGKVEVHGTIGEFRPTGSTTPNSIYGWYITESGGDLIAAGTFEGGPLAMGSALNNILPTAIYRPAEASLVEVIS